MHRSAIILLVPVLAVSGISVRAQQQQAPPPLQQQASQPAAQPVPAHTPGPASDGKIRIYVSDSQSWQMTGGWGAANGAGGGHESGGARPQTAEIIKTFNQRCRNTRLQTTKRGQITP